MIRLGTLRALHEHGSSSRGILSDLRVMGGPSTTTDWYLRVAASTFRLTQTVMDYGMNPPAFLLEYEIADDWHRHGEAHLFLARRKQAGKGDSS